MITHNRIDMQLVARVATPKTASGTATADWVVDLTERGGRDAANIVLSCPALSAPVTLAVVGGDARDGEMVAVAGASAVTKANEDCEVRMRIPLDCPRFVTLKVTAGDTAPSASVTAQMAVYV